MRDEIVVMSWKKMLYRLILGISVSVYWMLTISPEESGRYILAGTLCLVLTILYAGVPYFGKETYNWLAKFLYSMSQFAMIVFTSIIIEFDTPSGWIFGVPILSLLSITAFTAPWDVKHFYVRAGQYPIKEKSSVIDPEVPFGIKTRYLLEGHNSTKIDKAALVKKLKKHSGILSWVSRILYATIPMYFNDKEMTYLKSIFPGYAGFKFKENTYVFPGCEKSDLELANIGIIIKGLEMVVG